MRQRARPRARVRLRRSRKPPWRTCARIPRRRQRAIRAGCSRRRRRCRTGARRRFRSRRGTSACAVRSCRA
ncbi:MAG: hypothetical protein GC206_11715 [Alphaproteobacteria bacterium]|nr:hypothetical protein [Alphaproteobacteria bacterium]